MNRNVSNLILTLMLLMGLAISVFAQEAIIKVLPVSHHDLEQGFPDTTRWHSVSAGLKAVGVGELVYLEAMSDSNITSILWTPTFPVGSSAILDNTDEIFTTFRPDMDGFFEVQLSINGAADTSVTIVSSSYYGAGHVDSLINNPNGSSCVCHQLINQKVDQWAGTGHSTIFKLGVDGIISSHYSESCIECHTLGYNTEPEAVNGGFDDVALSLGWTFPAHPQAGEWDNISNNYPGLAVVASIQCENCHGASGAHMQTVSDFPDISLDAGMCGRCHDEPWRHYRNEQWKHSPHSFDPKESAHGAGARGATSSCVPCHSGAGFIESVETAIYPVKGDLYDKSGPGNVSCAACHDPHSAELRTTEDVELGNGAVVSAGGSGKLCMNCHKSRRDAETYAVEYHSHFGPHYGPQADMLAGDNVVTFGAGAYPSGQAHLNAGGACVTCHMAPTPGAGVAPDPNDPAQYGRDRVGDHTFHMYWEGDTTGVELDHTAGCTGCHGEKDSFGDFMADIDYDGDGTVEAVQEEAQGMMDLIALKLPPIGVTDVEVDTNYSTVQFQAAYNLFFVQQDGSKGIHNWIFTRNLLNRTYLSVTGMALFEEDDISAIPVQYVLEQNYPNPFNPSTTINFTLPKAEEIKLVVYDLLGKAIRTLADGQVTAGTHSVVWDGQDQHGNKVSTGLYIYRLESKSVTLARKMLLVK
jgi:hypothetical protein